MFVFKNPVGYANGFARYLAARLPTAQVLMSTGLFFVWRKRAIPVSRWI